MSEINLIELLPEKYQNILDYKEILKYSSQELDELLIAIDRVQKNMFIQTCDEAQLKRFEELCKLYNDSNMDIEARRVLVISAYASILPYTKPKLKEQLNSIVGVGNYKIEQDYDKYELNIQIKGSLSKVYKAISSILNKLLPAHIAWSMFNKIFITPEKDTEEYYTGFMTSKYEIDGDLFWTEFKNPEVNTDGVNTVLGFVRRNYHYDIKEYVKYLIEVNNQAPLQELGYMSKLSVYSMNVETVIKVVSDELGCSTFGLPNLRKCYNINSVDKE